MATLALNSGLWARRLLMGWGPFSGVVPRLRGNDGPCPEQLDHVKQQHPFSGVNKW